MLLLLIFCILLLTIIFLFFNNDKNRIKFASLFSSGAVFILSCFLLIKFDSNLHAFQNYLVLDFDSSMLSLYFCFGFDGISILFFWLSSLLIFLCILFIWDDFYLREYLLNLLITELLLLLVFSVLDLFLFYIFFEAILIPMYLIIGLWGSRQRKIRAVYLLFFYTLFGSLLMLVGILYIYGITGSSNLEFLLGYNQFTFD